MCLGLPWQLFWLLRLALRFRSQAGSESDCSDCEGKRVSVRNGPMKHPLKTAVFTDCVTQP